MKKFFCWLFILLAGITFVFANTGKVSANAINTTFKVYRIYTTTSSVGYFSVAHGIDTDENQIQGMTVSVQNTNNGYWYTLYSTNTVVNRFWWNDTYVQGKLSYSTYYEQPVRIVLFTYAI